MFEAHVFPFTVEGNRDAMHWHQYMEVGLCLKGTGRFVYFNKVFPVHPGDIFISNNFENHVAIAKPNESTEYLFLIFLPSFIASVNGGHWNQDYLRPLQYNPLEFQNRIPANHPSAERIAGHMQLAHQALSDKGSLYRMEMDIHIRSVLFEIAHYCEVHFSTRATGQELIALHIQKAIKYINNHFMESIRSEDLAQKLNLNASYLRHLFRANMQMTMKDYITHLRLSQARKLLLATDKSVAEIISAVGYTNVSQFYHVFKQHSHMTPAAYRKQYRNDNPFI